ncbi:2-Hydroxyacid oxidase 2-like [Glandiceps talaboti]
MDYSSEIESEYGNFWLFVIVIITVFLFRRFFQTKEVRRRMVCLEDYEDYAREKLPRDLFIHQAGGAKYTQSGRSNIDEFSRIHLVSRVLRSVIHVDLHSQVQDRVVDSPIGIAPMMSRDLLWPDGDRCIAKAAANLNVVNIVPMFGSASIEQTAKIAPSGVKWLQIELLEEDGHLSMVSRAEEAGFDAIVVTVDCFPGLTKQIQEPVARSRCGSFNEQQYREVEKLRVCGSSWRDIDNVVSATSLPVVIQGILNPDDAVEAKSHGAKGIIVSNCSASSLDGFPTPIDMLPAVKSAVGNVEVYLGSDVRNGCDVLKALALGAKCVFLGHPILYGLSYQGKEGVEQIFDILHSELRGAMFMTGCSSISRIPPSIVQKKEGW